MQYSICTGPSRESTEIKFPGRPATQLQSGAFTRIGLDHRDGVVSVRAGSPALNAGISMCLLVPVDAISELSMAHRCHRPRGAGSEPAVARAAVTRRLTP